MSVKKYNTEDEKKEARRVINKNYRINNKEKEKIRNDLYREKHKKYLDNYSLLNNARLRSVRKGIEFGITLDDYAVPDECPVLGIKLEHGHKNRDHWPTLDRKDNTKGYIQGNVEVISYRANRIKNDATTQELGLILDYMKR